MVEIKKELEDLTTIIDKIKIKTEDDQLYKCELDLMLDKTVSEYSEMNDKLAKEYSDDTITKTKSLIEKIINMDGVSAKRVKEYKGFVRDLDDKDSNNRILNAYRFILEVSNDFKKDNDLDSLNNENVGYVSTDNIDWSSIREDLKGAYEFLESHNGKKTIRVVKDISERTGMLHEKINSFKILKELAQIDNYILH